MTPLYFGPGPDLADLGAREGIHFPGVSAGRFWSHKTVRKSTKQAKKPQNFPPAAGPRSVFLKVKPYFIEYKYLNFHLRRSMLAAGAKILLFGGPFIGICKVKLPAAGEKI